MFKLVVRKLTAGPKVADTRNEFSAQIAYSLIEEQEKQRASVDSISFVGLLADHRYCGISYGEKNKFRELLQQDPMFWTNRPFTEAMVCAAVDDVRFLPYVCHMMMEKLSERSLWRLAVRGALYCRCFLAGDQGYTDWPPIPTLPDNLSSDGNVPEDEILSVVDIPSGKMGFIIGRKGSSIRAMKQACNAEILIRSNKGTPDKVIIIGPTSEVRKAEAMVRGRLLRLC
ncbi:hypothetical protein Dimus_027636 [Dionaea muscipula]